MLRNILIRLFINAAALWFVDFLFPAIWFESNNALLITAIIFGLLNAVIKPLLILLTLPVNILSLGLFTIVINAVILEITDFWVSSFHINGFGVALLAAILISLVSIVLQNLLKEEK